MEIKKKVSCDIVEGKYIITEEIKKDFTAGEIAENICKLQNQIKSITDEIQRVETNFEQDMAIEKFKLLKNLQNRKTELEYYLQPLLQYATNEEETKVEINDTTNN